MAAARAPLTVLVLAAGHGKRLRSKTIKLLHFVAGRPMVAHVVRSARALKPARLVTVTGHQGDLVRKALHDAGTEFVTQREQLGTGHAVLQAARRISGPSGSTLLILNGDLPTLKPSTSYVGKDLPGANPHASSPPVGWYLRYFPTYPFGPTTTCAMWCLPLAFSAMPAEMKTFRSAATSASASVLGPGTGSEASST